MVSLTCNSTHLGTGKAAPGIASTVHLLQVDPTRTRVTYESMRRMLICEFTSHCIATVMKLMPPTVDWMRIMSTVIPIFRLCHPQYDRPLIGLWRLEALRVAMDPVHRFRSLSPQCLLSYLSPTILIQKAKVQLGTAGSRLINLHRRHLKRSIMRLSLLTQLLTPRMPFPMEARAHIGHPSIRTCHWTWNLMWR